MTIQKGKVTVPQTINITVWPQLRRQQQALQQQHSRWQALRPQQACLLYGGLEANPALIKAKEPDLLAVEEDLVALRVEDSQVGVFQEEEPQEEEPQEELQEQEEETQN